ncbi:molybdenum cofactor biosynthesis protein MoaE [Sulfobacillus harzensis]|uniref:Molybdenum cofactor biosynthesis protein MoaE n=1 Tax=Sulfobacillus harzensis TaxID=2729629 RepID=A0A7Y0L2J1_9FIRM|nr:molybdenum cofactor biosynthesis protein MoaE [Sulfobacillus harzensis]NMP22118.1 molybdenum cofactor biosynthesis protein MoaE [Sulfobacillus harzensis]
MDIFRVQKDPINVDEALKAISDPAAGGQALFLGTVRNNFEGRASLGLFYEAYRELAEKEMARIGREIKDEFGALHVAMVHRVGDLALTETAVVVAVSTPHRAEAFKACQAGIDRIKERVPIWKKERWADGQTAWHRDPEA